MAPLSLKGASCISRVVPFAVWANGRTVTSCGSRVVTSSSPFSCTAAEGREIVIVVPWPTALSTVMEPPCCATIALAPANPMPVPMTPRAVEAR